MARNELITGSTLRASPLIGRSAHDKTFRDQYFGIALHFRSMDVDKILAHVDEALSSPDIRARVLRLNEELLRREPDLFAGYKVNALVSLSSIGPNGPVLNEGPEVEQALKDCHAFNVADKSIECGNQTVQRPSKKEDT